MKKKITVIICLVLAGALALGGCGSAQSTEDATATSVPDEAKVIVAEVDGEPIYYDDYYTQLSGICAQMGISPDDENAAYFKDSIVESMVSQKVLNKMLTDKGYMNLTDEQHAQAEKDAETDLNSYVEQSFKTEIEEKLGEGYTDEQYAAELESYRQQMLEGAGMSWDEVVQTYKLNVAEEAARAELVNVEPTEAEVRAEYDKKVASDKESMDEDPSVYESSAMYGSTIYYVPAGLRSVKQVLIKIDDKASEAISLLRQNEYNDQADQLLEKALADIKTKADEVLSKIQSGAVTFDQAVKDYNEDDGMPETGYAVSEGSDTYMEPFTTGAMALAKIGDISGLVATDYGYHILQYAGDVTPGAVDYEKLKGEIKEGLTTSLQDEKWGSIIDGWKTECDVKYYKENY